jgi:hypothetical protein
MRRGDLRDCEVRPAGGKAISSEASPVALKPLRRRQESQKRSI